MLRHQARGVNTGWFLSNPLLPEIPATWRHYPTQLQYLSDNGCQLFREKS